MAEGINHVTVSLFTAHFDYVFTFGIETDYVSPGYQCYIDKEENKSVG
jgi:hypothetical protein